jgi:transcriptional regulator with XRE-family HTH domain
MTVAGHYSSNSKAGRSVRRLREEAKLTRYELARDAAVSFGQLTNIEALGATPRLDTAVSIASALARALDREPASVLMEMAGLDSRGTPKEGRR